MLTQFFIFDKNKVKEKRNKDNIEFTTDPSKIKLIEKDGWYLKQAGLKEGEIAIPEPSTKAVSIEVTA